MGDRGEAVLKKKGQAEMKIGVGKGDWRFEQLQETGAIYTKEVLWAFNRSIIHHISSLLRQFLFSFSLSYTPYSI